jgi:hypothetical protein
MAYFQRLRVGGTRVGLAAFIWRIRMGDAWHRIFGGNSARSASFAAENLHLQRQQRPQRRAASRRRDYAELDDKGRTVSLPRDQLCNSDDSDFDNDGNDSKRSHHHRHRRSFGESKRASIDRDDDTEFEPLQQQPQQQRQRRRKRRYQHVSSFCESLFYLFRHYECNDEWWQSTSPQTLEFWKSDNYEQFMSIVHRNWYKRVSDQRRGASIYLQLQPAYPSYVMMRDPLHRRGSARQTIKQDELIPITKLGAQYLCLENRGGMWRRGTQWMFRYRIGDVPLAAMMSAIYDPRMRDIHEIPTHLPAYSNKCQLCSLNAVEDYDHVILECPRYDHERLSIMDVINEISDLHGGNRPVIVIPHSQEPPQQRQTYTMMHDDVDLFVAASQSSHDEEQSLLLSQQARQLKEQPVPWQWWLRSPVIRQLLSDNKYVNVMKRFLGRVMYKRSFIIKQLRLSLRRNAIQLFRNGRYNGNNGDGRNDWSVAAQLSVIPSYRSNSLSSAVPSHHNDVPLFTWSQSQQSVLSSGTPVNAATQQVGPLYSASDGGHGRIRFSRRQYT